MGVVHEEYGRFMQWLRAAGATEDTRRIAKIVHANLDALIPTVHNGGQRATTLTPMLRRYLAGTPDDIDAAPDNGAAAPLPWTRLKKLSVGPFRGFRREEQFDLTKDIILFLGPNGSGKSSLCEGIEFALLGYVEEATAKRIEDLPGYFNNFHEGTHVAPQLWSAGDDNGAPVVPNPELLRFTIIEKNRIEGFARLASRPPAQASLLIASLFGLDGFNTFVSNFTRDLDSQLRLATPKQAALDIKRAALQAAREKVDGHVAAQQSFNEEQEKIAGNFQPGLTYVQLLEKLGMHGQDGRLQEINAALQEQIPAQSEVTIEGLTAIRKSLREKLKELSDSDANLAARAEEVSFLDLYRAVHALHEEHADACPACETPLAAVTRNPFEKAAAGLDLLQDLAQLQEEQRQLKAASAQVSRSLRDHLKTAHRFVPFADPALALFVQWLGQEEEVPVWTTGLLNKGAWLAVLRRVQVLEERDAGIRLRKGRRALLQAEAEQLEEVKKTVDEIRIRRQLHETEVVDAQTKIDGFDEANSELIAEVATETTARELEMRIQNGYENYLAYIREYRDGLPAGLLADLNETTRDLYNSFNPLDHPHDILAEITLPQRGGERIMVSFAGTPHQSHDALAVLSEGHLRCLGLAILLAKNIKLGLPLLVFDDAVNAIDHDHRQGIRDTLFGDARLRAKQMIITCHSNEFITQVQNGLAQGVSHLYVLKHHSGDHQPRVKNGSDRHYLRRAIERFDDGDERQAMTSARQVVEHQAAKIWQDLLKDAQELATVKLLYRNPKGEPELRNLVDQLSTNIATGLQQGRLPVEKWTARQAGLNVLRGVPAASLAWAYLNKGVHIDDVDDFEAGLVLQVLNAIRTISATFPE